MSLRRTLGSLAATLADRRRAGPPAGDPPAVDPPVADLPAGEQRARATATPAAGQQGDTLATLLCKAPWAALYLDPRGEVKVCCQNEWLRLGNVAERSLTEIWRGPELTRLRERVAEGDLSLGCEMCQAAVDRGAADTAYFNSFAHLPLEDVDHGWPLQLDLALSNSCNLQCVMCNGELSSAIRVHREGRPALTSPYDDRFFEELDHFLPHLRAITFLGGEPFLARESTRVMSRLVELGLTPHCSVTTNGTQWNARIERFVERLPMHVAISVDAVTASTLERIRVGVDAAALFENIERFRAATSRSGGTLGFSTCLMVPNWHEFGELLEWADRLDVDVFVNTVHHPPHLSFAHCDFDQLGEVVEAMRAEDGWRRERLGRNRSVWEDQLASLEGLHRQRAGEHSGGPAQATPVAIAPRRPSGGVAVLRADERQLVREVDVGGAAAYGVDLEALLGSSLWESVRLISRSLGQLETSQVRRTEEGVEERELVFRGPSGPVRVRATMELGAAAEPTWFLAFEPVSDDPAA